MPLGGVAVTSPVRTCLDVARHRDFEDAVVIADGFLRMRLLQLSELQASARALAPGPGRLAAIRVAGAVDPVAGSVLESVCRVRLAAAGLPPPTTQLDVFDRSGEWIGRVDFAWECCRVILEVDGWQWHGDRSAFVADRRRWRALVRAGWTVLLASYDDVMFAMPELIECLRDVLVESGEAVAPIR